IPDDLGAVLAQAHIEPSGVVHGHGPQVLVPRLMTDGAVVLELTRMRIVGNNGRRGKESTINGAFAIYLVGVGQSVGWNSPHATNLARGHVNFDEPVPHCII